MKTNCSRCGAPAPDDGAVFCNRCGTRLHRVLYCRKCGKTVTDPQSRFCDHCGTPIAPEAPPAVPPITLAQGKVCPACGFENFVSDASFCKKCGSVLGRGGERGRVPDTGLQSPAGTPVQGRQAPVQVPAAPFTGSVPLHGAVLREPVPAPVAPRDTSGLPDNDIPSRSNRKRLLIAAAVIFLLVVSLGIIFIVLPGISGSSSENATAPDLFGGLSSVFVSGNSSSNTTAPGFLGGLLGGVASEKEPVINQATPVITDKPLKK
jgi:hypothetical protein